MQPLDPIRSRHVDVVHYVVSVATILIFRSGTVSTELCRSSRKRREFVVAFKCLRDRTILQLRDPILGSRQSGSGGGRTKEV